MPVLSERAAKAVCKALTEGEAALDVAATSAARNKRSGAAHRFARASDSLVFAREIIESALADDCQNDREPQNHVPGGCQ